MRRAFDRVQIESIYDPAGRMVRRLGTGSYQGGIRNLTWDGRDERGKPVTPGIYLVRIVADSGVEATKRLVLFR